MAWIDKQYPDEKTSVRRIKAFRKHDRLQDASWRAFSKVRKLTDRWNASKKLDDGTLLVPAWIVIEIERQERKERQLSARERKALKAWFRCIDRYRLRWAKENNRPDLIEASAVVNNALKAIFGKPTSMPEEQIVAGLIAIVGGASNVE